MLLEDHDDDDVFYRNIIVDEPSDQTSRWSSDNDNHPQVCFNNYSPYLFIVLILQKICVLFSTSFLSYNNQQLFKQLLLANMKKHTFVTLRNLRCTGVWMKKI